MLTVRLTPHLKRFFPVPDEVQVEASTLPEMVQRLDDLWPGLAFYVVDERGALRENVAIWVDGDRLLDRSRFGDPLRAGAVVHVMQALSGG
ncbi:MAG: MoaD/ThiS family protein [Planctomycetota bacterium]